MGEAVDEHDFEASPAGGGPAGSDREGDPAVGLGEDAEPHGHPDRATPWSSYPSDARGRPAHVTPAEEEWFFEILDEDAFERSLSRSEPLPAVEEQERVKAITRDVQEPAEAIPCRRLFARLSLSTRAELRAHALAAPVPRTEPAPQVGGRWIQWLVDIYSPPDPSRPVPRFEVGYPLEYPPFPLTAEQIRINRDSILAELRAMRDCGMEDPADHEPGPSEPSDDEEPPFRFP